MNIPEILSRLQSRMVLILSYKNDAKNLASIRNRHLIGLLNNPPPDFDKDEVLSGMNFFYKNPANGTLTYYGTVQRNIQNELDVLRLHKNKQYLWLLAEAYEAYEDFLEMLYATAGHLDRNFWPLAHFGTNTLADLCNRDWQWYLDLVHRADNRLTPEKILTIFRKKLPFFEERERSNATGSDLRFSVALITHLRHHIVHTGGNIKERAKFEKNVLDAAAVPNNVKREQFRDEINDLFFLPPHGNTIAMLEREIPDQSRIPIYHDLMENYCRKLLSSAHLLADSLENYLEKVQPTK